MVKQSDKRKAELILLVVLSVVLTAVLFVQFVIVPLMNDCSELEAEISKHEFSLSLAKADIIANEGYLIENAELYNSINRQMEGLCSQMTSEEFDCIITGFFSSCGLSPKSLECEIIEHETEISVITSEYTAEGSYSEMLGFIEMIDSEPSIVIDRIEMKAIVNDGINAASADRLMFTVVLSVYMNAEVT